MALKREDLVQGHRWRQCRVSTYRAGALIQIMNLFQLAGPYSGVDLGTASENAAQETISERAFG
jgi:hypothetical protein